LLSSKWSKDRPTPPTLAWHSLMTYLQDYANQKSPPEQKSAPQRKNMLPGAKKVLPGATMQSTFAEHFVFAQ
jgi:hypothetical protein